MKLTAVYNIDIELTGNMWEYCIYERAYSKTYHGIEAYEHSDKSV